MTISDRILREGKSNLSGRQLETAKRLEDEHNICTVYTKKYIECVNPDDEDYYSVPDKSCEGEIEIEDDTEIYECPECRREAYLSQKSVYERHGLVLNHDKIYIFVRDRFRNTLGASGTKKDNGLTYCGETIETVIEVENNEGEILVQIIPRQISRSTIEWIRIYDRPTVNILVDDGLALTDEFDRFGLPYFTLGELLDEMNNEIENSLADAFSELVEWPRFSDIQRKATLSIQKCRDESSLCEMGWDDFEHCVNNILTYVIGTSYIYGGTEPGTGVPDGTFTLNWKGNDALYMWDAKFVDLTKNTETNLSDEYSKIFRHLSQLQEKQKAEPVYDEILGITLFSPGIAETSITRLAEFIHEQNLPTDSDWNGCISYFELESLLLLAELMLKNESNVHNKKSKFEEALHEYLTSPAKHENDPEVIADTDCDAVHMGAGDIQNIFDYLDTQGRETYEFDKTEHLEYLKFHFNIGSG
ncbi:hypothetical protein [Halorubrum sp. DTA98]|uniref:hypothetical protein n=1 Tax=Halorubrum sp. DTA98 TaxID=3402163 RepID=UPI003AAAA1F9